jgi:ribonuclease D
MSFQYIQTQAELEKALEHLSTAKIVAFDTEFDRNHYTYGFTLCLVQIATSTTCFLIDPFAVQDLSGVWSVLENPDIEILMHDCNEDMRLMYLHNCSPNTIFDTSWAGKFLELEKIGLGDVLQQFAGITANKKNQQSNWTLRPLSTTQLEYAANDVLFLFELRQKLTELLQKKNRWDWFEQMMIFIAQKNYAETPSILSKQEQKMMNNFGPFDQHVLTEMYRFRDQLAARINKPPYQAITGDLMLELFEKPTLVAQWLSLKGIHYKLHNNQTARALETVRKNAEIDAKTLGIPTQKARLSSADFEARHQHMEEQKMLKKRIFEPIKKKIEEQYGTLLAPYLLSNEMIDGLLNGRYQLSDIGPIFQQKIISQTAHNLSISWPGITS